jgi:hypothetical protein
MRSLGLAVAIAVALSATATAAPPKQTLFFDAVYTKLASKGPGVDAVGHQQIASGKLRDVRGHGVGSFAFTCRWVKILTNGDARERCTGHGKTRDGRIDVGGPSLRDAATHTWSVTGGTGAYRSAHGTVVVRDLGTKETLASILVTPRRGVTLHAGVVANPAANAAFRKQANARCRDASSTLDARPPFPFAGFDPLHPDPSMLPDVGRFLTGAGDPRPALRALGDQLAALGEPPAQRTEWARLLAARAKELVIIQRQDDAALAADAPAFVASVNDASANFRAIAISATLVRVTDCVL